MAAVRLGIGLKLGIVSGLLILLAGGVIVSRQVAMTRIESAAQDAQRQAAILQETEKVSSLLDGIRLRAAEMRLSFAGLENDNLALQVASDVKAAQGRLDNLLSLVTNEAQKQAFTTLKTQFAEVGAAVADIQKSQAAQLSAVDSRPAIGMLARAAFAGLASRLEEIGRKDAAQEVQPLGSLLDSINLASYIFIIEDDRKQLILIRAMLDRGLKAIDSVAEATGTDPHIAESANQARTALDKYVTSIRDGIAEVQKRTKIVQERANPSMVATAKLLQEVTDVSAAQAAEADQRSDQALNDGMFQILLFSIISILAAIASAAYSVFGIARPVQRMSDAMERVSGGDLTTAIPFAQRSDEVGDQARALTVFRDGLAEAERMRDAQHAEERAAAESRKTEMNALADQFETAVGAVVDVVAAAATELQAASETLSATAEETTAQAAAVGTAAQLATRNVQSVAAAIEELSASAREIGDRLQHSTQMTERAVTEVDNTNTQMSELRVSAEQVGTIIGLIDTIAGQTNLLALNATIESARAGEAGRGFAVVAQEVKGLAGQTAKATADISQRISDIQDSTGDVLGAISGFSRTISELSAGATAIAAAMEEQNATTSEVARSIQDAATGTNEVTTNIASVERAAQASSSAAVQVLSSATDLSRQAESLRTQVRNFVETVRAA